MILGIGSSGPQVAEGWHGQRFANQLQRTREYVAVVRMALARERVEFHGETLELPLPDGPGQGAEAHDLPGAGAHPDLPRGDRPEEHRARGRDRRRVDPHALLPRARLRAAPPARGGRRARRANRSRASTSPRPSTCSSPTTSRRARNAMRPVHRPVRRRDGLAQAELLQQARPALRLRGARRRTIQDLYLEGKREEAMAAIPDELIDTVSLCGPEGRGARAPRRLPRRRRRHARDHPDRASRRPSASSSCACVAELAG